MHNIIEKIVPKHILGYLHPKDGITMSEANHIANMTKQIADTSAIKINSLTSSIDSIVLEDEEHILKNYTKPSDDDFQKPGLLFGLSAWLRQAVKAKDEAVSVIESTNLAAFTEEQEPIWEMLAPSKSKFNFPLPIQEPNVDKPFGTILNIAEYSEYLALEAKAAFLGKCIHQNMPVDKVRNEILNFQPVSFMKFDGTERLIKRKQLYTESEINDLYFDLQRQHREAESKLNWYKAKIKNDAVIIRSKLLQEYTTAYNEAQKLFEEAMRQYNDAKREYDKQFTLWSANALQTRKEVQKLFSSYRIIIPESLREPYEFVLRIINSEK